MLLGGLWHGANVTYIIWGAWHGVWLAIERALGVNAAPRVLNPLKWVFTFLLVIVGWVIFRAENLHVAWRMYEAMFSFGDWKLSELNRASLTGLQVGTLVIAYLVLAFFGLRQFYKQPMQSKAPKAAAKTEQVDADGPASAQPRTPAMAQQDPAAIAYSPSGAAVYQQHWMTQLPVLATRFALLLLFAASVLKLSAQSYSPFLYFQF
jgi:alginate O-acetyltransferase complex protein AlgI